MTKDTEKAITKIIGRNLKLIRKTKNLAQSDLARVSGVSFQQAQKYERGINRMSGVRFYQFSKTLDVPIKLFFEGIDDEVFKIDILHPNNNPTRVVLDQVDPPL